MRAAAVARACLCAGLVAGEGAAGAAAFTVRLGLVARISGSLVGSATPTVERWAEGLPAALAWHGRRVLILLGMLVVFDVTVR